VHEVAEKRILLRSGKDPLRVVSPENTLQSNLIGNNSGNLLFSTAATRILAAPGTEIAVNGLGPNPGDADLINETYDAVVLPFANAYRPSFEGRLKKFTELIERLTIPVVVLSSGAQSSADYDFDALKPIEDTVRRFARAVLDRSASIGVRGEFTGEFLNRLGFRDVDVIGCPSMFLFGGAIQVKKREWPGARASIAVNASSSNATLMGALMNEHAERYPEMHYVAQDRRELEYLLWGQSAEAESKGRREFPANTGHRLYEEDRVRFFLDPWPWLEWMRERDLSFGTRIHGNLIALLAGTPAYVLAHDSRTLELARYFDVPHRRFTDPSLPVDAAELYEEADFSGLESGQAERCERLIGFLEKNGLEHTLSDQTGGRAFEEKLAAVPYPPAVGPASHMDSMEFVRRVRWLRSRQQKVNDALVDRIEQLERAVSELREEK
jgi:hypothetical protein